MKTKIKSMLLLYVIFATSTLFAQDSLSILFIGNSYTYCNDLPKLVQNLSESAGKQLNIDSNTPGGMTLLGHLSNSTTVSKIKEGCYDYVILQEQSQIPTIDYYRYNQMYPAITNLKAMVEEYNPCARVITYMTWGRRYGGQQCDATNTYCSPDFVDFNHMQDSLTSAYMQISDMLNIQCAPVGVTWQNILNDSDLVLHSSDDSHPNLDGSYVAALTIFSAIWKEPTSGNSFDAGLSPEIAQYYQQMSDSTVFNSENDWNLYINNPNADFTYSIDEHTVTFTNTSTTHSDNIMEYFWDFGDGNTSADENPTHTYDTDGLYNVSLLVKDCFYTDSVSYSIQIDLSGIYEDISANTTIYPNPFQDNVKITTDYKYIGTNYSISDLSGKVVHEGKIDAQETTINLNKLPDGLYFLRIGLCTKNSFKLLKIID